MRYFDAHCHIQFPMYDGDREDLARRMEEESFGGIVVGVDLASSKQAVELAETHPHLWASVGLHPNHALDEVFDEREYLELLKHPKVVAVGECGLDNFRPVDPEGVREAQRALFKAHVRLALQADKPLMIHARPRKGTQDAYEDLIEILRGYKAEHGDRLRGDIHFFVGGVAEAAALVDLGFTLSYTAVLTFTADYDAPVASVPLESLLTETDSPYAAPQGRRGERNDPFAVRDVVAAMARIREEDEEVVREAVLANARRLFGI